MTALIVVAVVGWIVAVLVTARVFALNDELKQVRAMLRAGDDASVQAVVEQALTDADDRVASAEAVQHWLMGALDEAVDAIVVVDRIGREVVRNAAAQQFLGARHAEVLAEDARRELLVAALAGESVDRELQLYGPPPQVLHLRAVPLRATGGEIVGAVAFTRDISESRRVESVRRDFVANVRHKRKTPIGALALLAETMAASDDVQVMQQLADRVVREADRLAHIVDDLLDLSVIEAQEAPTRRPVPAGLLVAEAVDLVRSAADAAGVPVEIDPQPPELQVVCDQRQMRSALRNLLDNAIKYSPSGNVVQIGAHVVDGRIAFVVRDHGIGIPTRDLERIFERFYRVDRARSRDTGGTGLGLSIVRHVAHAHGGDVTVASHEGEGSTFTLNLPLSGSQPDALAGSRDAPVRATVTESEAH